MQINVHTSVFVHFLMFLLASFVYFLTDANHFIRGSQNSVLCVIYNHIKAVITLSTIKNTKDRLIIALLGLSYSLYCRN